MLLYRVKKLRHLQGWQRTLAIVFVAQLASAMGFSIIFPFLPLYVEHLGSSSGLSTELLSGLVISAQAFTMMIAGPIWGALADRYGRKMMFERATFGGAIVMGLMGFAVSAEQLVLLRAIQGVITGTVSAANALVAAQAPRERMGYAMSTIQVGLWSGVALGPLIGGALADAFGFRMPFLLTAVLLAISGALVWRGVREQFTPAPRIIEQHVSFFAEWRRVLGFSGVSVVYVTRFMAALSGSLITPISPLFVASLLGASSSGISTATGLVAGVSSATGTLGGLVLGRMGDRIGHRKILVWSAVAAGLFYLPQAAVGEVWQLIVLQGLFGLASGGLVAAPSALLAHFTPPGAEGAVYGLDNSVTSFGRTLSPMIGSGIAMLVGLRGPFAAAGLTYLAMGLVAFLLLPRRATLSAAGLAPDEAPILPAASPETDALPPPAGR